VTKALQKLGPEHATVTQWTTQAGRDLNAPTADQQIEMMKLQLAMQKQLAKDKAKKSATSKTVAWVIGGLVGLVLVCSLIWGISKAFIKQMALSNERAHELALESLKVAEAAATAAASATKTNIISSVGEPQALVAAVLIGLFLFICAVCAMASN